MTTLMADVFLEKLKKYEFREPMLKFFESKKYLSTIKIALFNSLCTNLVMLKSQRFLLITLKPSGTVKISKFSSD